jgi:hypothetical protein
MRWLTNNCHRDNRFYGQQRTQAVQTHCDSVKTFLTCKKAHIPPHHYNPSAMKDCVSSSFCFVINQKTNKQTGHSVKTDIDLTVNSRTAKLIGRESSVEHADGLHNVISDCTSIKASLSIRSSTVLTTGELFSTCVSLCVAQNAKTYRLKFKQIALLCQYKQRIFLPQLATLSRLHLML